MKIKYFDYSGNEYTTLHELKIAYYYIEYPNKQDYINILHINSDKLAAEHEYKNAKLIYKNLSKIFKDNDIINIGMTIIASES